MEVKQRIGGICRQFFKPLVFVNSRESRLTVSVTNFILVRCLSKTCFYSRWSSWSATCGDDVKRTRRFSSDRDNYVTVKSQSECSKYKSTCERSETQTKSLSKCPST